MFAVHPFIRPAVDPTVFWNLFSDVYKFERKLTDLLFYPTIDVFFKADFARNYIPPSWTMRPELFGSLFIFLIPWSWFGKASWRTVIGLFVVSIILISAYGFVPFIYYLGFFIAGVSIHFLPGRVPYLFFLTIIVLCIKTISNYYGIRSFAFDFFCSYLIVLSVYQSKHLYTIFASRPFVFLGKISFPLYLVHVPLVALIAPRLAETASIFQLGEFTTLTFIFLPCISILILLSWLLVYTDQIAVFLSRKIKL